MTDDELGREAEATVNYLRPVLDAILRCNLEGSPELPPLLATAVKQARHLTDLADRLRAAVAAERERCARWCDFYAQGWGDNKIAAGALADAAAAIRRGPEPTEGV